MKSLNTNSIHNLHTQHHYLRFALERNGPDDQLMVHSSKCSSNEGTNPENPLQILQNAH
ncbi:hypothetical protein HanIR_Chr03g0141461 [Helianthus annuus]|nr:hypothetical protein HanIR_Chr03g0141461 [Helianthus annuus]